MRQEIQIGGKKIGRSQPLFIISECGVTCNYDMTITKQLIDTVKESGADAIKFIFWFPDEIMSDRTTTYSYQTVKGKEERNMYEMLNELRFTLDEWREVKKYADQRGVILFSTVNSPSGIAWAEKIGLQAYKLSSWDFNYHPLWKKIAALGKPMIIDTGPAHMHEVAKVLQIMRDAGNDQSILVHCFHTEDPKEMNMRSIPYMEHAFNTLVGYSSVDTRDEQDIAAVALGAVLIEKRLTMGRDLPGHHQALSKEPAEFKGYVRMIRAVHASLGMEDLKPSKNDLSERKKWFRHLVANEDLAKGTVLRASMLEGKRGEHDVSPEYLDCFVGCMLNRDLKKNEAITWDAI